MDWYPRFQTLIIDGYRLGKSITATLKCTPGVGSTTMAPLYFLPLITAVVVVLPFFVKYVFSVGDENVSFSVLAMHEVAYPSADSLSAYVFHGHAGILARTNINFIAESSVETC